LLVFCICFFLFIISFGIHKVTASFIVTGLSPSPAGLHRHSPKKSKQPTTTIILDIPRIDHDVLASRQPGAEELLRRMPNAEFILSLWRSKCDRRIEYAKKRATNQKKEEVESKSKGKWEDRYFCVPVTDRVSGWLTGWCWLNGWLAALLAYNGDAL
jgi:hypothetical protein